MAITWKGGCGGSGGGESYVAGEGIEIDAMNSISALRNPDNTYTKDEIDSLTLPWQNGFRNKNLGTELTAEQAAAIAEGDFTELWNGDYWEIGGRVWRIVDNTGYMLRCGDTEFTKPHLVVWTDDCLLAADGSTTKYMKDTNDTTGGLRSTKFISTYAAQCNTIAETAFGADHIGAFRDLQTNTVTSGLPSSWAYFDAKAFLPNEAMIYGTTVWSVGGLNAGYNTGALKSQLALLQMRPEYIVAKTASGDRQNYWLRDVVSSTAFAAVSAGGGGASGSYASIATIGLRPLFLLI